ncbi:hypothetical protein Glove_89g106 [Diversispora epigaea]|uniref:Vacuolar protein-sorting-associated protein 36 n=1 Tax=Diversispora epigaea TaxID=1348612 RepID=A0A397JG80_9GLOM|nr:hypothetical protein Glove_89g106 [Diversispora epigaea]
MNRFTRVELTSSLRPVLADHETVIATQDNVGLYDGNDKAGDYTNGIVYLTSHRIVYVDAKNPTTNSVAVDIRLIKGREIYTGILKSSLKITLKFSESSSFDNSPSSSSTSLSTVSPSSWVCPICSFKNQQIVKCQLCGVKKPENFNITSSSSSTTILKDNNKYNSLNSDIIENAEQQFSTSPSNPTDSIEIACPSCTFLNHPSMINCELCDAELGTFNMDGLNMGNDVGSNMEKVGGDDRQDFVKLSFRRGNSTFYDKLKMVMSTKEWEKTDESQVNKSIPEFDPGLGGISAIFNKAEQSQKEQDETLNQAFKDLDGLMTNATEVVKLAESIKNKISKDPEFLADETSDFRTYLVELGIQNPVTKDSAGSIYHKELARQLAEFLENLLAKENGMIALTDIYCIFNRARGVSLISPDDLYKACSLFEHLSLPMRLRKFASGLSVLVGSNFKLDEQTAQRIIDFIKDRESLTAIELASLAKMSVVLAIEQLQMVEAKGLICRDETVEGIRFYDNLIINTQPEKLFS